MIIFVPVCIKEIIAKGRDFPWPRPGECPRCNGRRVWGHGFVPAFFDGYSCQVFLRRYRCPDCHCVVRLRPLGYFKRFQAPIEKIRSSIAYRLRNGRWPLSLSRARQGHWLRSLGRKIQAHLKAQWIAGAVAGFDRLVEDGIIPVCRSI